MRSTPTNNHVSRKQPQADVRPPEAILSSNSSLHSSSLNSPPRPTRPCVAERKRSAALTGLNPAESATPLAPPRSRLRRWRPRSPRKLPGEQGPEARAAGARPTHPELAEPGSRRTPRPDDQGAAPARGAPPGPRSARRAEGSLRPPAQLRHLSRHLASTPLPPPQARRPR